MSNDSSNASGKSRGIYLLPNLFTTAGLFSGFYAIVASMNDRFIEAAVAIFIAMVFDGLDGRVARMTNTESDFGAEFDSMADIVSFGMAPALVMYNYALADLGKIGWLAAFIFVAGGALRLARFNTNLGSSDKKFFQGLAIPSAAAIVAGLVWVGSEYGVEGSDIAGFAAVVTICAGLLMVTNFRYHSFKDVDWKGKVSFLVILVIVLAFVIVATQPSLVLFSIFFLYALSGPVLTIKNVKKLKLGHVVGDDDDDDADFNDNKETKKEAEKTEKED
ncbi:MULTISPECIES: CDP-diacylglycerol--serine O-phosphatidyltransferase [Idiomarina]|jgi:CDP-diacylglycerol--serine O-phosphatidyltransferase|uniref:CDP-diacylglycerol--serine O-phosphatidyltransferase n=3 Tax=Idiomarina TaxID=135575 RepID=A0A8I1G995_9GAMM|nr:MULTISPECIES: CDP-diacylglycerol--serine O-phosphatidyltransferase [Idiomarina]RDX34134.1 CDP-diacylglycerol--serine O-phosphatidyltransferase [Idiomarina sp. HD9-110m-PIT-SAG05]MBH94968.1 CDP-diacylglycerol--serine O-phosphatidyltransferase [Idiomarina sp.]MBJ7267898.1 CDP-diacylglycerol--serine O-phosphatidyltransferase [Idiomarina abyssalis]MBJ7274834.1 CDP-diacylglycerol--serine O-phosphatidyltransferase [Idiomarina abyssalis]MBJ7315955.1 CDP-diacylglycerol--serine O-phosphatidyltransfe|tara:strand:+ start:25 stop:852 length:828 start_codon:yes stop_codon:yes gene_type:complete